MNLRRHILKFLSAIVLANTALLGQQPAVFGRAPLLDLEGRSANPFGNHDARIVAFIFVRTDCPISNSYAPEIKRLHERFASRGVSFWVVYPAEDESPGTI